MIKIKVVGDGAMCREEDETSTKPEEIQEQGVPVWAYCANSHKHMLITVHKFFTIPNGQASWWRCSACQGWHVYVTTKEKLGRS